MFEHGTTLWLIIGVLAAVLLVGICFTVRGIFLLHDVAAGVGGCVVGGALLTVLGFHFSSGFMASIIMTISNAVVQAFAKTHLPGSGDDSASVEIARRLSQSKTSQSQFEGASVTSSYSPK